MPKRKPTEQPGQGLDMKKIYESLAKTLREKGLKEKQIAASLAGLKRLHTGVAFSDVKPKTLKSLGLSRNGGIEQYWKPEMKMINPSQKFLELVKEAPHAWGLTNEAANRVVINMFLHEVVVSNSE